MRTLGSSALSAIAARSVPVMLFVEMDLTSPLNLCTANVNITYGGKTYYGLKGLGRIGTVTDTPAEVKQLQFELSGAPSELVSLALSEPVQGKAVRIKVAIFDPSTYAVLDVQTRWQGLLDTMTISDGKDGAAIAVTAEHAGIDLTRPASNYYTDPEQQALHPGDLFFQYTSIQVEQRIVWPDRTYGQK